MVTVWSTKGKLQLQKAFDFIKENSLQNAEKIRDEIIEVAINLTNQPA